MEKKAELETGIGTGGVNGQDALSTTKISNTEDSLSASLEPQRYRLKKIRKETHDTFTLELEPADGQDIVRYRPGQFNMLYAFGKGEVPISISGDPDEHDVLIHTIRRLGHTTRSLTSMKPGSIVGLRGPFGTSWPVAEAEGSDVVIVAGGIGLAPLRPAMYHVLNNRRKYGDVVVLYGARTPADIIFQQDLTRWGARFDVDVHVTVDHAKTDWYGSVGVVTKFIKRARFDPQETVAFVCGPEVMMRYTSRQLLQVGVDLDRQYLTMERNMQCAVGWCGHCQFGQYFVCRDGPVFRADTLSRLFTFREM